MKLKFRKGGPPLKIMERGDHKKPKIGWKDLVQQGKAFVAFPKPWKLSHKIEMEIKPWRPIAINASCPLCKKPLTRDNMHTVYLNRQTRRVHKTCPGELDVQYTTQ